MNESREKCLQVLRNRTLDTDDPYGDVGGERRIEQLNLLRNRELVMTIRRKRKSKSKPVAALLMATQLWAGVEKDPHLQKQLEKEEQMAWDQMWLWRRRKQTKEEKKKEKKEEKQ